MKLDKNKFIDKSKDWKKPKLFVLDKKKTEGGEFAGSPEGGAYTPGSV